MSGPFKLRSGNTTPFKMMGSSPAKQTLKEIDEMIKMETSKDYSKWKGSDAAKSTGRTADQERELTLKQLNEMKAKHTKPKRTTTSPDIA